MFVVELEVGCGGEGVEELHVERRSVGSAEDTREDLLLEPLDTLHVKGWEGGGGGWVERGSGG